MTHIRSEKGRRIARRLGVELENLEIVLITPDVNEAGFGFETEAGDAYGASTLEDAIALARSLGLDYEVES